MRPRRIITVAAATLALAGSASGIALAAQNNSISGTAGGSYYTSNADRHVTTPNDTITITLDSFPGSGVSWQLVNANSGAQFGDTRSIASHNAHTLATNVRSSTVFHNRYKAIGGGGDFSGSEYY